MEAKSIGGISGPVKWREAEWPWETARIALRASRAAGLEFMTMEKCIIADTPVAIPSTRENRES
jgi:hypothetical protein